MKKILIPVLFALLLPLSAAGLSQDSSVDQVMPEPMGACHLKCSTRYRCNQRCRHKKNHEHCMTQCNRYKERCKARCDRKKDK